MDKIKNISKKYLVPTASVMCLAVLTFTALAFVFIGSYSSNAFRIDSPELKNISKTHKVGIVFGGGVANGSPMPLLQDRLDAGYELLAEGYVEKLILSGDNRFLEYNEPLAMYNYLTTEKGVNADKLQVDYAGRSTYETCERAKKVFHLDNAVLVTDPIHMPRALFLCTKSGINSVGLLSVSNNMNRIKIGEWWREILARDKAIINIYAIGEKTVLGDPIDLNVH